MNFAIGYIHPSKVHHNFMESLIKTLFASGPELVSIGQQSGANLSWGRNEVIRGFLAIEKPHLDGLLSIDTDIVFTLEDVKAIVDSEQDIIGGLYWSTKSDGSRYPVFNIGTKAWRTGVKSDIDAARNQPFRVAGCGMGFTWIARRVIEALAEVREPGGLWPFAEIERSDIPLSEDLTFCARASDLGFQSWVDPRIKLGHMKEVML